MRPSTTRTKMFRSTAGTIAMALTLATVIGGISMEPALAQQHDRRQGEQGRDGHGRERHDQRDRREYQPRGYYSAPPVIYAPPPVFYAPPPPSPGISLFFPLTFR